MTRYIPDVDKGVTYLHSSIRPQTNEVREIDRWLPAGVRQHLRNTEPGQDLAHLPLRVLDWMYEHGLTTVPTNGSHQGLTILSPLGKKLRTLNLNRLKGTI